MKSGDKIRSSTLRMVLTALTNAEGAGKQARELTDADVLGVLSSESKKRREAAEAFAGAGRDEQAAKERAESEVIAGYLPEQLSEEEIVALVSATIAELGVREDGMRAIGRVMGALQPKTKDRADGGVVAAVVRAQLAGS
ncbi:MAG: GatB/YqeY domain-containing protein [Marmoricola sp.]